jgi:hypothetical protein
MIDHYRLFLWALNTDNMWLCLHAIKSDLPNDVIKNEVMREVEDALRGCRNAPRPFCAAYLSNIVLSAQRLYRRFSLEDATYTTSRASFTPSEVLPKSDRLMRESINII